MIALLDGDIFAFRVGCSCEKLDKDTKEKVITTELRHAYSRLDTMLQDTLAELGIDPADGLSYRIFLTDSKGNFRKQLCPEYKTNRKAESRPYYLPQLEAWLIDQWGAERAEEEEADDMMGKAQTKYWELGIRSVIVSIDKDLHQVPGTHYNFVKSKLSEISASEGDFFFYRQLLMGDSTDNVGGCPGIGPKKSEQKLRPFYGNPIALYNAVYAEYQSAFPNLAKEELEDLIITVGRMVYIRRYDNELWLPPQKDSGV